MGIYLDAYSHIEPFPRVIAQMCECFSTQFAEIGPPHPRGKGIQHTANDLREKIVSFLQAPDTFEFQTTSGGPGAYLQWLLSFYLEEIQESGKNHIVTGSVEDGSIGDSLSQLERLGCCIKKIPFDSNGQIRLDLLEEFLKTRTSLCTFSWASGWTGVIQPVESMARLCYDKGVKVHLYGNHRVGSSWVPWDGIDYLTFDGSSIGTPPGIGGLFRRRREDHWREEDPVAHLCALATALEEKTRYDELETARFRDLFEMQIQAALPDAQVLFQDRERLSHISLLAIPGVVGEALLYYLHKKSLFASIGGRAEQSLSAQLKQCGFAPTVADSAVRFSFSRHITEAEMDQVVHGVIAAAKDLGKMSRFV